MLLCELKKIKQEFNNINDEISELSKKREIINSNELQNKILRIISFSFFPWVIVFMLLTIINFKGIIIFAPIISGLSFVIPGFVGLLAEKLFMKKRHLKESLEKVTYARSQQELFVDEVKCVIEMNKLHNKNEILKNIYNKVVEGKNLLEVFLNKYDIVEKKNMVDSKVVLEQNIENINFELEQKENKLDLFLIKQVLVKEFFSEFKTDAITSFIFASMFFLLLNAPIILRTNLTYQVSGSLLNLVASFFICSTVPFLFIYKKRKIENKIFEILNDELGENALLKEDLLDKCYSYENEINDLLEEISALRLDLEYQKVRLESIFILDEKNNEEKKENYNYKFNVQQLNGDILSQQVNIEKSKCLTRKKLKEDNTH